MPNRLGQSSHRRQGQALPDEAKADGLIRKRTRFPASTGALAVFIGLCVSGCATTLYDGRQMAASEVATLNTDFPIHAILDESDRALPKAARNRRPIALPAGKYSFILKLPKEYPPSRSNTEFVYWLLPGQMEGGRTYLIDADVAATEMIVSASGEGVPKGVISNLRLLEKGGRGRVIGEGRALSPEETRSFMGAGQNRNRRGNEETGANRSAEVPAPSPPSEPRTEIAPPQPAGVDLALKDFGSATTSHRKASNTSGAIVSVVLQSAGRLEITGASTTGILGDGARMGAAVAFLIDAPSDLKIMMLPDAEFEGMDVSVAGKNYQAYGSMAKMAAILTEKTGIAFEGRQGDEIKLGLVFNCPASKMTAIEISGSRVLVSKSSSRAIPASTKGPTQSSEGRLFQMLSVRNGEEFKATAYPGRLASVDLETYRGVTIQVKARAKEAASSSVLLPISTDDFRLDFELDGRADTVPCIGVSFLEEQWALAAEGPARVFFNLSLKDPKLLFLVPKNAKKARLVQIGPASGALVELPVRLPKR